ncbi:hypothetical protein AX16_001350 [Volvariella volvacea WC 439]|nr:hypothetical protein AX16_001350 [Volvariella volvacea WC 439]
MSPSTLFSSAPSPTDTAAPHLYSNGAEIAGGIVLPVLFSILVTTTAGVWWAQRMEGRGRQQRQRRQSPQTQMQTPGLGFAAALGPDPDLEQARGDDGMSKSGLLPRRLENAGTDDETSV